MNIYYRLNKIKVIVIILAALLVFGLARWTKLSNNKIPLRIDNIPTIQQSADTKPAPNFVASKNGGKYYPLGCKAGDRIKLENRIFFTTEVEAETAGYTLTVACP